MHMPDQPHRQPGPPRPQDTVTPPSCPKLQPVQSPIAHCVTPRGTGPRWAVLLSPAGAARRRELLSGLRVSTLVTHRAIWGTQKRKQTELHIQRTPCQSRSPRGDNYNHVLSFGSSPRHDRTARVPCINQRISNETVLEEARSINHQRSPV